MFCGGVLTVGVGGKGRAAEQKQDRKPARRQGH